MSDTPSRTSIWVAAARAFGAREPDAAVRNPDYLAQRLLTAEELALLGEHPVAAALDQDYAEACKDPEVIGMAASLIARTRFIDEHLEAAVREEARQIVILGAGFDTRAYRFADLLKDTRVLEVDRPATQEMKLRRVREAVGEAPANLTYVAIDLGQQTHDALFEAGYRADRKTFFIWEGVTMYLPAEAVEETLRWIVKNSPAGSAVVFDYVYDGMIRMIAAIDMAKVPEEAKPYVERWLRLTENEPWVFGLMEGGEEEFLRGFGLEVREKLAMGSKEAIERYLTRADGSVYGYSGPAPQEAYFILEAVVRGY